MKKTILSLVCLSTLLFSQVEVGKPMKKFDLKDQFDKSHKLTNDTKKVIYVSSKPSAHKTKEFFATKDKDYLSKRDILFVADVTAMPSFIKFFVLPITGYDYPIVMLDNDKLSKEYKPTEDNNAEKIMVISLKNGIVEEINYFDNIKDLQLSIEG